MDEMCEPPRKRHKGFLTPRERMEQVWRIIDKFGPQKPKPAEVTAADYKHRSNIALTAAAIQATNSQLSTPLRMRFDHGPRPCSHCALSAATAYHVADGACASCGQDLCRPCLQRHKDRCSIGHVVAPKHQAAADDSTDDSESADSESDISIE